MEALTILRDFQRRGFTLSALPEGIQVSPSSALTESDRQAIREHKAGLLGLLSSPQPQQKTARALVAELIAAGQCPDCRKPMSKPTASYGALVCWTCDLWIVDGLLW